MKELQPADLAGVREELVQARAHLAATQKILQVISQSRTDTQPVFEAIHDNASILCGAQFSGLFLIDETGGSLDLVSLRSDNPDCVASTPRKWALTDRSAQCRAAMRQQVVHVLAWPKPKHIGTATKRPSGPSRWKESGSS